MLSLIPVHIRYPTTPATPTRPTKKRPFFMSSI